MAGAKIDFTDGTGAATLQNWVGAGSDLGKRFKNWVPDARPVGVQAVHLASGLSDRWNFRTDYTASFEVPGLTGSQLEIAARLKIHLINGGQAVLTTDDTGARTYTVTLAPGTEPTITGPDEEWRFTFSMIARNTAAAVMRCTYSGPSS